MANSVSQSGEVPEGRTTAWGGGITELKGQVVSHQERQNNQPQRIEKQHTLKDAYAEWLAEIEADPSFVKEDWERKQWRRDEQWSCCRERGCDGFPQYAEAVKRRLARHGFTRPFHLHEDLKQQDKLTTWIEYLNFECWWLDRHTSVIEHFKPAHDKAWQELVDLKVLRPHETPESVRTMASAIQERAEEDQAWGAVKRAKSEAAKVYKITQDDPWRLHIPKAKRIPMLGAATNKLNTAKERLQWIKRRNDQTTTFVQETSGYDDAKRDAARQSMLIQWLLEQVPLIEAEMTQSKVTKTGPGRMTRSKRRLTTDEEPQGEQSPKRPKLDHQESGPPASSSSPRVPSKAKLEPLTTTDQEATQGDDNRDNVGAVSRGGPRRSARIAARRDASRQAQEPAISQARRRPKSRAKPAAQPSDPRPNAEGAKASTATGRELRSVGRRGVAKPEGTSQRRRQPRRG
ncbi:hypothetical protein QQZ08_009820 [Neonectria magnoliae]|uniref:Uncharacterized protein n=1 Tax=Neonectria magnoliae TaxID=2732573 RepID=A0ABR1HL89_9HYPO